MCTGSLYLHDCPVQRMIPIYLLVGGIVWVYLTISILVRAVHLTCLKKCSDRVKDTDECDVERDDPDCSCPAIFYTVSHWVVASFLAAWFTGGELLIVTVVSVSVKAAISLSIDSISKIIDYYNNRTINQNCVITACISLRKV